MRFLVFGTGAVGGLMGARLALAGHDVVFLARSPIAKAIHENGLKLIESGRSQLIRTSAAMSDLDLALHASRPDLILLCVKAYDCAASASLLEQKLSDLVPVMSLLNGINNEQTLAQRLGMQNVIPATLTTAVQMVDPGVVQVERRRGVGIAGNHPMVARLIETFNGAGFQTGRYPNPERMKWSKLMTNIVSNATSAITGFNPDEVFAHPGLARMEIDALRETTRVMHALGFTPQNLPGVSVALLGRAIFLPMIFTRHLLGRIVASGRGQKKPSLHYDIGRGKSEASWLNGAVVRYGKKVGIRTPVNHAFQQSMEAIVEDENAQRVFLGNPDALLARAYPPSGEI